MSISIPSISGNLKFEISNTEVELNTLNQEFNEVYSYQGYGNLISACFKLSRDAALFRFEIDGNPICDLDVAVLSTITHASNREYHTPIVFDTSDRVLIIKFDDALNFSRDIKFLFKRNSNGGGNNARVQLESYAVTITKETRP
jgi:hypothetical protein